MQCPGCRKTYTEQRKLNKHIFRCAKVLNRDTAAQSLGLYRCCPLHCPRCGKYAKTRSLLCNHLKHDKCIDLFETETSWEDFRLLFSSLPPYFERPIPVSQALPIADLGEDVVRVVLESCDITTLAKFCMTSKENKEKYSQMLATKCAALTGTQTLQKEQIQNALRYGPLRVASLLTPVKHCELCLIPMVKTIRWPFPYRLCGGCFKDYTTHVALFGHPIPYEVTQDPARALCWIPDLVRHCKDAALVDAWKVMHAAENSVECRRNDVVHKRAKEFIRRQRTLIAEELFESLDIDSEVGKNLKVFEWYVANDLDYHRFEIEVGRELRYRANRRKASVIIDEMLRKYRFLKREDLWLPGDDKGFGEMTDEEVEQRTWARMIARQTVTRIKKLRYLELSECLKSLLREHRIPIEKAMRLNIVTEYLQDRIELSVVHRKIRAQYGQLLVKEREAIRLPLGR